MCFSVSRSMGVADDPYTTHTGDNFRESYLSSVRWALIQGNAYIKPIPDEMFRYLANSYKLIRYPEYGFIPLPASEKELDNLLILETKHTWRRVHVHSKFTSACHIDRTIKRRAVVSGQSISGMIAAMILAKNGYEVHTYEIREKYTRNIQWAIRASLVNTLASIDGKLAALFQKIASPLHKGSFHILNGVVRIKPHDNATDVDPNVVPPDGNTMIKMDSVFTVEARVFEEELKKYLSENFSHQVHSHIGKVELERRGEVFEVKNDNLGTPDLVVIAEGANSSTRNSLLQPKPMTESRWQIAGAIAMDGEGVMIKQWRQEAAGCMLTGAIGHAGAKKIWIVADVDSSFAVCPDQKRLDAEFRRVAALVLQKPIEEINQLDIYGPSDEMKIRLFPLQQTLLDTAAIGNNLIFMGDAVGSGHWSVGGGLQIAVVCHGQRLNALARRLHSRISKLELFREFSDGVLHDTKAWLDEGRRDFYPSTAQPEEIIGPITLKECDEITKDDIRESQEYSSNPTIYSIKLLLREAKESMRSCIKAWKRVFTLCKKTYLAIKAKGGLRKFIYSGDVKKEMRRVCEETYFGTTLGELCLPK